MAAIFRLATLDDAPHIQAIYAAYCDTPISFELLPPGVDEMRQRMAKVLERFPWLVCEDGAVRGYAYAYAHRERPAYQWSVETSVYIQPGRHRGGLGRALYTSLFEILALQGFFNAYAGVTIPNPASEGLHESMGFEPVGVYRQVGFKLGAWHDTKWYQKLLQERPASPLPPRPIQHVQAMSEWNAALNAGREFLR